jgi:predicted amidohydrolase
MTATVTYNMDIDSLHAKHLRLKQEVEKCQSANLSDLKAFDVKRIVSYIEDLKAKLAQVVATPEQDLPEFSPHEYTLEAYGENQPIENELLIDFLKYLHAMDFELIN